MRDRRGNRRGEGQPHPRAPLEERFETTPSGILTPDAFLADRLNREAVAGRIEGLELDTITRMLDAVGDPHRAVPVIHITGTNGKGSVAALIARAITAMGLRVGAYTSPHLERVNERITVDGEAITDEELVQAFETVAVAEALTTRRSSYFEALTMAAFDHFVTAGVHVAVVEVGLLGRFDATNVVDAQVAVVTSVGEDHTDGRGDWRQRIAEEKAGIITPRCTAVIGPVGDDVLPTFLAEPAASHWVFGRDVVVETSAAGTHGVVGFDTPCGPHRNIGLGLLGAHQRRNATLAGAALDAFFDRPTPDDVLDEAWRDLTIPGRLELPAGFHPPVLFDVAHNRDGADAQTEVVRSLAPDRRIMVLGLLEGRDVGGVVSGFDLGPDDVVVVVEPDSPRAVAAAELIRALEPTGASVVEAPSIEAACARAMDDATANDLVVVTGSFQVVGPARAVLTPRPTSA